MLLIRRRPSSIDQFGQRRLIVVFDFSGSNSPDFPSTMWCARSNIGAHQVPGVDIVLVHELVDVDRAAGFRGEVFELILGDRDVILSVEQNILVLDQADGGDIHDHCSSPITPSCATNAGQLWRMSWR